MIHKYIKLLLTVLITIWSGYEFYQGHIMNGISILLLAGIILFLYFKNEILLLVFLKLRKQNFEGATRLLDKIKKPENALIKKQQGYYNLMRGIMISQTNLTQAEKYFRQAIKLGLNMKHDLAMAKLQLAGIAMTKRRKREATTLIAEAKKLDKHNMLADQIKLLKDQMKRM